MFRLSIPTVHLLIEMGDEQAIEIYDKYRHSFKHEPSDFWIEVWYAVQSNSYFLKSYKDER